MSTPMFIVSGIILFTMCCLLTICLKPLRSFCMLLLHTALGWAGLYIWNICIPYTFGINIASATITGVLGIPGVLLLTIIKWMFL